MRLGVTASKIRKAVPTSEIARRTRPGDGFAPIRAIAASSESPFCLRATGMRAVGACLDNKRSLVSSAGVWEAGQIDQQREFGTVCLIVHRKPNPELRPQL